MYVHTENTLAHTQSHTETHTWQHTRAQILIFIGAYNFFYTTYYDHEGIKNVLQALANLKNEKTKHFDECKGSQT